MLGVAFFVMALFLVIRIVVVMMLIIVAPLAFFAAIIPDFSKMSSQWWSSLFEYSYYGPAAAFFLLLTTRLDSALPHLTTDATNGATAQNMSATITNITHYLTTIVFLYASIFMAKKFGGGAGAAIVGNANKFMKWGAGMTKTGGMWGAGARVTGAADVYKGVKQGIGKQPFWRVLTKEGRTAASKERQEKWEGRLAPFDIANVKKKSKEIDGDDLVKVNAGVAKGDAASILQAASRGKLTAAQLATSKVRKAMEQNADFENSVYKNLRDTGNGHLQYADMVSRGKTHAQAFDTTFKGQSINSLAEQNELDSALASEATQPFGSPRPLFDKLNAYSTMPIAQRERLVGPLLTRAKDPATTAMLQRVYQGLPPI